MWNRLRVVVKSPRRLKSWRRRERVLVLGIVGMMKGWWLVLRWTKDCLGWKWMVSVVLMFALLMTRFGRRSLPQMRKKILLPRWSRGKNGLPLRRKCSWTRWSSLKKVDFSRKTLIRLMIV